MPLDTQKPLYITTAFLLPYTVSRIRNIIPTVWPSSLYYFCPIPCFQSSTLAINELNKIEVSAQLIVWRSFPKGWGLRPRHKKPGHYLLSDSIMDSSNTFTHDGLNSSSMFLLHASSHCLMRWNPSSYYVEANRESAQNGFYSLICSVKKVLPYDLTAQLLTINLFDYECQPNTICIANNQTILYTPV